MYISVDLKYVNKSNQNVLQNIPGGCVNFQRLFLTYDNRVNDALSINIIYEARFFFPFCHSGNHGHGDQAISNIDRDRRLKPRVFARQGKSPTSDRRN